MSSERKKKKKTPKSRSMQDQFVEFGKTKVTNFLKSTCRRIVSIYFPFCLLSYLFWDSLQTNTFNAKLSLGYLTSLMIWQMMYSANFLRFFDFSANLISSTGLNADLFHLIFLFLIDQFFRSICKIFIPHWITILHFLFNFVEYYSVTMKIEVLTKSTLFKIMKWTFYFFPWITAFASQFVFVSAPKFSVPIFVATLFGLTFYYFSSSLKKDENQTQTQTQNQKPSISTDINRDILHTRVLCYSFFFELFLPFLNLGNLTQRQCVATLFLISLLNRFRWEISTMFKGGWLANSVGFIQSFWLANSVGMISSFCPESYVLMIKKFDLWFRLFDVSFLLFQVALFAWNTYTGRTFSYMSYLAWINFHLFISAIRLVCVATKFIIQNTEREKDSYQDASVFQIILKDIKPALGTIKNWILQKFGLGHKKRKE